MGWAKYYEDNISIINNRLIDQDTASIHCFNIKVVRVKVENKKRPEDKKSGIKKMDKNNLRKGLELSFKEIHSRKIGRMLQMNGWWWSPNKKCWCNCNNEANRRYAENTVKTYGAKLRIVSA
jgi:hypothetical protein